MNYMSTRDTSISYTSAQAMKQGLSKEGGLFVPENIASFEKGELEALAGKPYREAAFCVMKKYLTDFTNEELWDCIDSAYNEKRFSKPEITPLVPLTDSAYILEDEMEDEEGAYAVYCGWQNYYDPDSRVCDFYLTLFEENQDGSYARSEEHQRERCYTLDILKALLEKTGFEFLGAWSDFDLSEITETTERYYIVARAKK